MTHIHLGLGDPPMFDVHGINGLLLVILLHLPRLSRDEVDEDMAGMSLKKIRLAAGPWSRLAAGWLRLRQSPLRLRR